VTTATDRRLADAYALIDVLKGSLAAQGMADLPVPSPMIRCLCRQERALVGALLRKFPNGMTPEDLLAALPSRDHVRDRDRRQVSVLVHGCRAKLGAEAIETLPEYGYRLCPALHAQLSGTDPCS